MTRRTVFVEIVRSPKSKGELIISISAIAISLMALTLSIWQARQTITHNKLNVFPNLTLDRLASMEDRKVGLFLKSTGLGPAVIKRMVILLDGEPVAGWDTVSQKEQRIWLGRTPTWSVPHENYLLPKGEKLALYVTDNNNISDFSAFRKLVYERLMVRLTVCSVYGECEEYSVGGTPVSYIE